MFWHSSNRGFLFALLGGLLANGNLLAQQPGASTESDPGGALQPRDVGVPKRRLRSRGQRSRRVECEGRIRTHSRAGFLYPWLSLFVVRFGKQSSRRKLNDQRSGAVLIRRSLQR